MGRIMATLALLALFLPLVHGACMSVQMCTDYTQTYNPGATAGYYCEGPAPAYDYLGDSGDPNCTGCVGPTNLNTSDLCLTASASNSWWPYTCAESSSYMDSMNQCFGIGGSMDSFCCTPLQTSDTPPVSVLVEATYPAIFGLSSETYCNGDGATCQFRALSETDYCNEYGYCKVNGDGSVQAVYKDCQTGCAEVVGEATMCGSSTATCDAAPLYTMTCKLKEEPCAGGDCTPDDWRCMSSIGWDCCTAADRSLEDRACSDGYIPIYTGVSCYGDSNAFTCYPPSCTNLPEDNCGPNKCNSDAQTVGIIIFVVIVLLIIGCIAGGILACYCAKCCCFQKRPMMPAQQPAVEVATVTSATGQVVATPAATPQAAAQPVAMPVATPQAAAQPVAYGNTQPVAYAVATTPSVA